MPARIPTIGSSGPQLPTYLPGAPRYKLKIFFDGAHSLPIADVPSFTSDPYIIATLRFPGTSLPKLHHRTRTIRSTRAPTWEEEWTVENVPASGVMLKMKVMDEDPGDGDDVLGVTRIETGPLGVDGRGNMIGRQQTLKMGSGKWVTFLKIVMCSAGQKGVVDCGLEVEEDRDQTGERPYTVGPNSWTQHFSPLIGIITHTVADNPTRIQHYTFAATKLQLSGPVPPELNQRYVAFRPIIKTFYTKQGLLGIVLNRALKHQYRTIYSYDKATKYGLAATHEELAHKLLEFTNYGEGGRLYTYIITLDGEWRFTETGKEFGIQMLSKHTMHSCVNIYVAMAGEFFVKRVHRHHHHRPRSSEGPSQNLKDYELVIDNDSGTYRPPKDCLPFLQQLLSRNLPGLKVRCPDAFEEDHIKEKKEHVAEKERQGRRFFKQPSSSRSSSEEPDAGSISSSDEEEVRTGRVGRARSAKRKLWRGIERKVESGKFHEKGKAKADEPVTEPNGESAAK